MKKTQLVLASASPRRQELLRLAGLDFITAPAKGEERFDAFLPPGEQALELARQKAAEVFTRFPDCTVIGADTIVALEGMVFGKPRNAEHARDMLTKLSGRTHSVFTGVYLLSKKDKKSFCQETKVSFYSLTLNEINSYISSGEPFDKAGAYGIQGRGGLFVERLEGDYWNVVGLPLSRLIRCL